MVQDIADDRQIFSMAGEPRRTHSSQIMDSHIGEPGGGANALPRIEHFRRGEVALVRDVRPIALEGKHIIVIPRQGLNPFQERRRYRERLRYSPPPILPPVLARSTFSVLNKR